ncbi:MAG: MBL fold metallo-hydrolase RNA specificity domain-containing protein, partial [Halobacteria archaeon]|nr:MBL fold metallo-hydrolase RNA specificity domain-containing protein [Halobacteria archaeon]
FSAHADSEGLKEYVERGVENGVERVLTVHGDERDCVGFADWIEEELGVEARAPELGEEVVV